MTPKSLAWALAIIVLVATSSRADDPITLTPATIELTSTPCGDGWKRWDGIGNVEGAVAYRERLTALAAQEDDVWVGTSHGRLLSRQDNQWTLQGTLQGIQITGIAFEGPDKVWLSTSDGIRRLDRADERTWKVSEYREYYEGHPSFVSGAYIPGEDAVRLWGYVDDIYIPRQETAYSPFVISRNTVSSVGAATAVFGTTSCPITGEPIPLGWTQETCSRTAAQLAWSKTTTAISGSGHSGMGSCVSTLNARKYHARNPDNNKKDGTEFSHIGATEVGCQFDTVVDLAASADHGVWAVLSSTDGGSWLARFDGQQWETLALEAPARSVAEINPASC